MKYMRYKVLVSAPYMQPVIHRFRDFFSKNDMELVVPPVNERMEESELIQCIDDIDGVICGDDRFTEKVLEAAPKLKVISKWGTGIDSIDSEACRKLNILVCNTPNAFSEPVGDTVLGYILCFSRNLFRQDQLMKSGVWEKIHGMALSECTLGVVGVGNAGKAVVRRAVAFGMKVVGNDIVEMSSEFLEETGIGITSLDVLLQQSDFVSINCDLNPTSYHLMSDGQFKTMKPTAYLINRARGPVVDEKALINALETGKIAGAALDVFEVEPLPKDSPLRYMNNVLLAPHNANSSPQAWERVHWSTINNLLDGLRENQK